MIISRSKSDQSVISFTVIREFELDESYKENCYAYLALKNSDGEQTVPSFTFSTSDEYDLYHDKLTKYIPKLLHGTVVRHIGYNLPESGALGPGPGNLYHYLHCSMFDPLLPFRVMDFRYDDKDKIKDELVSGTRNRLMKLVVDSSTKPDDEKISLGSKLRHYRPMEYHVPPGTEDPTIGIEYWVVFNYRKSSKGKKILLRSHSNELFVTKGHPIIGTLNGQNQGELTAHILRDVGLGMISRHIIIHVDATELNPKLRRYLFATTREGFKEGVILNFIRDELKIMLSEDEELQKAERELTEKLVKEESTATDEEVKREVTKLLKEAGFEVAESGPSYTGSGDDIITTKKKKKKKYKKLAALPTLPYPNVTRFEIVYPEPNDIIEVRINDNETVIVETDADAAFDKKGMIAIRSEPSYLEVSAKVPLRGGRMRWRLRPKETATVSDIGKVTVTLTKPNGTQIVDSREFIILKEEVTETGKKDSPIPPFEIKPINPDDDPEGWDTLWPDCSSDSNTEKLESVAYKTAKVGNVTYVYYSTVFSIFKKQIEYIKANNPNLAVLYVKNYEVWIAYHAILQEMDNEVKTSPNLEDEEAENILELERKRVATMQVKQAAKNAEIQESLLKMKASSE